MGVTQLPPPRGSRVRAMRRAQGLPELIEEPGQIRRLVELLKTPRRRAERRRAA